MWGMSGADVFWLLGTIVIVAGLVISKICDTVVARHRTVTVEQADIKIVLKGLDSADAGQFMAEREKALRAETAPRKVTATVKDVRS